MFSPMDSTYHSNFHSLLASLHHIGSTERADLNSLSILFAFIFTLRFPSWDRISLTTTWLPAVTANGYSFPRSCTTACHFPFWLSSFNCIILSCTLILAEAFDLAIFIFQNIEFHICNSPFPIFSAFSYTCAYCCASVVLNEELALLKDDKYRPILDFNPMFYNSFGISSTPFGLQQFPWSFRPPEEGLSTSRRKREAWNEFYFHVWP